MEYIKMNIYQKVRSLKAALATGAVALSTSVFAAIDDTAVNAALTAAQSQGETTGTSVIAVVAGLAVIGVVIAIVRKL